MPDEINNHATVSNAKIRQMRALNLTEDWLQQRIFEDPSILGLGDLIAVKREKRQKSKGRLDILLKNPTDNAMFEVEVMLGETDETHIIRTIEYWDFERRQYPMRQHYAVLVAEAVTRRFFNVIQLLSASIPILAIQANIVETDGRFSLAFTKILDVYSEPDDEADEAGEIVDEAWWNLRAPWVLSLAKSFLASFVEELPGAQLSFVQSYISVRVDGKNLFWFSKKAKPNTYLGFKYDSSDPESIRPFLDEAGVTYGQSGSDFYVTMNNVKLNEHKVVLNRLVQVAKGQRGL